MSITNISSYQYISSHFRQIEEVREIQSIEKTLIINNSIFNLSKKSTSVISKNIKNEEIKGKVTTQGSVQKQDLIEFVESVMHKKTETQHNLILGNEYVPKNNHLIQESQVEFKKSALEILLEQLENRFKLDLNTIKSFYNTSAYDWINTNESNLSWWLESKWKGTNVDISPFLVDYEKNGILSYKEKQYIFIKPHYWEVIEDTSNLTFFLKNKKGEQIQIRHENSKWSLGGWEQQRAFFYFKNIKLNDLDNQSAAILDKLLQIIFHQNPGESISNSLRYSSNELLILIALNIDNKILCNDLLKLRKMIFLATNSQNEMPIKDEEIKIINALSIPIDIDNIKKMIYDLYPDEIDKEKYIENLHNYYTIFPSAEEINKKDNILFIKGIAYTEGLMHAHSNSAPIKLFWQAIFNITKNELLIKDKKNISSSDKDELAYLNIAKYHAYTLYKYIDTYTSALEMINAIDMGKFNTNGINDFNTINESKKLALPIYYKIHENVDIDTFKLNDAQLLMEYDRIIASDNKVSDILENITSAIFYKLNYPYNISVFDFLKARVFHDQRITALIKEIYTFVDEEPQGYISSNNFKTSKKCNSQSEFTSQFNEYIDNGSSEYESKLLTPLFLSQLNIYPETLSFKPTQWFTLELTIEETKMSGLRWPVKSYKTQKEKINIIKLKNSDYIIISALQGDFQVKLVRGIVFEELLKHVKNKKPLDFLPLTEKNLITELIIGDDFESNNSDIRYELIIESKHDNPSSVKDSVQKSIHLCLNEIAKYKKIQLDIKGIFQEITESFIPFYREFYYKITDKHYKMDRFSIIMDVVFMGPLLSQISFPLKKISNEILLGINHLYAVGKKNKLSGARLSEFIAKSSTKTNVINEYISLDNSLVSEVSPLSSREITNATLTKKSGIVKVKGEVYDIISQYKENNLQLEPCIQQGRFKGVYKAVSEHELSYPNYYIKNNNDVYKVKWDSNLYTWRMVEEDTPTGLNYGPAIKYLSEDKWNYNDNVGLLGGGLESDNLIESISDVDADATSFIAGSKDIPANSSHFIDDSLFNKELLKNNKKLKKINKVLVTAQKKSIKKIKAAHEIATDDKYLPRVRALLKIFTNRQNEQRFIDLLNGLRNALLNTNLQEKTVFVIDETSDFLAQITPYAQNNEKYIAVNYAAYKKSVDHITSGSFSASRAEKLKLAKENLVRTIIHEFSHIIENTTDRAGYIELLHLDGKHDITKLLIKSKLELPEVSNNADSLTEIIIILAKAKGDENYLNNFLDHYAVWESIIDERINELTPIVQKIVEESTGLSWNTTAKTQMTQLNEAFNVEMSKYLISEIDEKNKIFFDLIEPLDEFKSK
ncbi:hypothetical protein [Candidatus Symbiopectobacterium sp. NZEC135]|uniref:hypothetical protein n=1 Tax=Candidatus Symbiopectobacterium sp. NZEC135 TaxID=2820471 RepID=UPI0022273052|nr:hypothetical protein [Candidatus Symbiopectobacterium sp. NZEC135]MCW2478220.1 hypothetical protein [Candidatus Symbiopectobacterium sp. NZEC135]